MERLLKDTSIIRTPFYNGQFTCSLRDINPYNAYLSKTDTFIIRTLIPVPLVSVIKRFYCTCNSRPQKFPSVLPIVLIADFIRRNDALSRGVNLYPQRHVPVDDFSRANLSIWHHEKSLKKL